MNGSDLKASTSKSYSSEHDKRKNKTMAKRMNERPRNKRMRTSSLNTKEQY
jgi:hypothetical protein